jgi:hypothetical protein
MTRRGRPVVASGRGAATIKVMLTSRTFAGDLLALAEAHWKVGGGGDELSQKYMKIGTGVPPGNRPGYAA